MRSNPGQSIGIRATVDDTSSLQEVGCRCSQKEGEMILFGYGLVNLICCSGPNDMDDDTDPGSMIRHHRTKID